MSWKELQHRRNTSWIVHLEHGNTVRRSDRLGEDCHWKCALSKAWWQSLNLLVGVLVIASESHFLLSTHIISTLTMSKCRNWQRRIWSHHINPMMSLCQWLLKHSLLKVIDYQKQHNPLRHAPLCPNTRHSTSSRKTVSSSLNAMMIMHKLLRRPSFKTRTTKP